MAVHAPKIPADLAWLNVHAPISLEARRGRPVLMEFFTPGCINCLHAFDETAVLEKRFAHRGLLTVRVLSPKFDHEKGAEAARAFVERHRLSSPVLLDPDRRVWDLFAVKAWPTFVLIDEKGNVAMTCSGEGKGEVLARAVEEVLKRAAGSALGDGGDIRTRLQFHYPSRATAGRVDGRPRVFVSDAGNHRVVALDGEGRYLGSHGEGDLRSPQGLALVGDTLYVCDAGHHRVVAFDVGPGQRMATRDVVVVAGSGRHSFLAADGEGVRALDAPLNSPWSLCPWKGGFMVALAGSHQLAFLDIAAGVVRLVAGSGVENLVDGSGFVAALAQPSGACAAGEASIAFVDAESSALRVVRPDEGGRVETLVGAGLFTFGHADGPLGSALFQHCNDVAASRALQGFWVCDSYNGAVRFVSTARGAVWTAPLGLEVPLSEPGGLCVDEEGDVWIVDTNNHRVVRFSEPPTHAFDAPGGAFDPDRPWSCRIVTGPFGKLADFIKIPDGSMPA
jgi:sugar lactone lactonase YvrE/peroxiredoxin